MIPMDESYARHALNVAADHPAFGGHFPGSPVLPGVVLLDDALHAACASGFRARSIRVACLPKATSGWARDGSPNIASIATPAKQSAQVTGAENPSMPIIRRNRA